MFRIGNNREEQREYLLGFDDAYTTDVRYFVAWCDGQGLPYTMESLAGLVDEMVYRGYATASIRRRFYGIKKRLRQLIEVTPYEDEDQRAIALYTLELRSRETKLPRKVSPAVKPMKFFTVEEIQQLVKESKPRTSLWIEFLYLTGLRISEAVNIRLKHLRQQSHAVYSVRVLGKGKRERTVYINSGLRRRIREAFEGEEYLFENQEQRKYSANLVWKMLRKAGEDVLGRVLTPHCLRHSFTSHRIKATGKLTGTSLYLGHSDISTTLGEYNNELLDIDEVVHSLWGDRGRPGRKKHTQRQ